jgi:hypothetical protein
MVLDVDRDGILSAEEIAAAPDALRRLDRDNDGAISQEELRGRRRQGGPDGQDRGEAREGRDGREGREGRGRGGFIMRYDANTDGIVTREEYNTAVDEQFDRIDKNHDGKIDQEEAAAAPMPGGRGGRDRRSSEPR